MSAARRVLIGTSGFSYPAWKGPFYPKDLPAKRMLTYYGEQFPTVEINNTFYRLPTPALVESWQGQTPPTFRFGLKAPQRITHHRRLRDAADVVERFVEVARMLGAQLGPLLFQLPPNMKADVPRLEAFLAALPPGLEPAFEFRHESWFGDPLLRTLEAHGAALCVAESDDFLTPREATAPFGYLRLRRSSYTDAELATWARYIHDTARWEHIYAYLKHDDAGLAPTFARRLGAALA